MRERHTFEDEIALLTGRGSGGRSSPVLAEVNLTAKAGANATTIPRSTRGPVHAASLSHKVGTWKKTNIQFSFEDYRGLPLQHYSIVAYIVDVRTGERVLLGASRPTSEANTGTTGVVTFRDEKVPSGGTLVLNAYPVYVRTAAGEWQPKGEFVGDLLAGKLERPWKRTGSDMIFSVSQEVHLEKVRARSREEADEKIRASGKLGTIIGPMKAGASGGAERANIRGTEVEVEYSVKYAGPRLEVKLVSKGITG